MNWNYIRAGLVKLREEKDWSDNEFARRSGVPQPTISRFFEGTSESMHLDTLAALCKALGVSVAQIIGETPIEHDDRTRRVVKLMEEMADYKKDVVVSTAETLARPESKK